MPEKAPPFTDPEFAREAQRKSVESRKRRAEDPEGWLRARFADKAPQLSEQLLKAALGEDEWHELPLDKRLTALTKAMEYAVGKPTVQTKSPTQSVQPEPSGLSIE